MQDVVIISNYWDFPFEKSSSRYHSIASLCVDHKISTEVITSKFYHTQKKYRNTEMISVPYKVTLLDERIYKKNISVQRILAHSQFAINVVQYLSSRRRPDVIYLFVPPVGLAKKIVTFAKKNNIRVVIDIQDLWPEAFSMILPPAISALPLYPMKRAVEYAYQNADSVIAVSNTYVNRALQNNKNRCPGHSVFIGIDLRTFDNAAANAPELTGKLRPITMAYIGMLGHSYDLCSVMDAMAILREDGLDTVELLIMGDGPLREKFEHHAIQLDLPVRFTGRLPYEEMVRQLVKVDIGLNILNHQAEQSIINKHADYAAASIPIINVQKNQEFGELLQEYNAGLLCKPGDVNSLADAIRKLALDDHLRIDMGKNCRKLAENRFDRNKTYHEIIDVIKGEQQ